ncbi:MAG: carboxymuconolactone decarboxylase family protein [Nitrospinae bacterium]|nr:carboxymuconolactone decarboxylase family protein [Nitrospinota bacterium]
MELFTQHTEATAPEGANGVLIKIKERYGFVPNLASYVAESPLVLGAVLNLSETFDKTSFTEVERQIVLLTVSMLNRCDYCKTAHTALCRLAEIDDRTLEAALALEKLPDAKLNALRDFAKALVEEKGWVDGDKVRKFLAAGYSKAQVFEAALGVALKTLTNYCNHLAGARPNPEFVALARGNKQAV